MDLSLWGSVFLGVRMVEGVVVVVGGGGGGGAVLAILAVLLIIAVNIVVLDIRYKDQKKEEAY